MRSGKQTGYILLPVIVVITLVAAIALLMNTESALESNTAASELDTQQAQYVAEAGLNHALWLTRQQGCGAYTNLTDVALGSDKYTTNLTTDLGATTSYPVNVDQDSWIREDQPTENKATDLKLHTRYEIGRIERPLLRYDLGAIPAKATILSATAWFYVTDVHPEGPVDIHAITADWLETDATWDSMNDKIEKVVLTSIPAQPSANVWVSANLTSQVQAWVNGQPNYGITLNSTSEDSHGQYNSRESVNAPYLEVIVGTPPSSPATLKGVGTLANGVNRTIIRDDVTLYQSPPSLFQFQPDASQAVDSYIWAANKNSNYGNDDETWVATGSSNEALALFRFDLAEIPPGAKVVGASLSVYERDGNDNDVPISAHRITNDWQEDQVTWNKRDDSNNWDNPGGDYDPDGVSTTLVDSTGPGPPNPRRYEWDVSSLVLGWANGSFANHGVVLRTEEPGIFGERFDTSDHADPTRHPRLNIRYTCACGEVCVQPQGSGRIVMVGNWQGSNPDPRDLEKEAIIESWGYQVDQWDDNFIWSIDFNNYDLVYISETTSSGAVVGQLSWRSIAIVNEQGNLNQDLGFSSSNNTTTGDSIDIIDNSHFISLPFALGELSIYSAPMEILTAGGTRATELTVLGEAGASESLMLLDVGAAGVNGAAPGRRVSLPLGRATNSNFNWKYLNNNGRLLVQRALAWGVGAAAKSSGTVLLVVVDPGSLTTQETAKKTLFESWGYAVNLIDESDSQANYDTALAANDVVYITEDVTSSSVNTKLVNAAIGVVTEEDNLSDEFGMAAGIAWESGTQVEINDNLHYITSPFSLGLLTIFSANESLAYVTGTQSPDLGQLASSSSGYGVVTLDAGDAMFGGGAAVGRRAQLPWGGDNFDVNHLNDDGLTILQRALEWGAGAESPDFSTELLFVVADPSALTSAESAKKTLIESWGYTVNLIDDADPQNDFDAALVDAGVVYVGSSASDTAIGDKLTNTDVGVVTEVKKTADNFGMAPNTENGINATAIELVNNTHYITEVFATGPLTILDSLQEIDPLSGTFAPDLAVLDQIAGPQATLAALDGGGMRIDATPSTGRRVKLPWGPSNFDFSLLNDDGRTIMKRAIEWAGGVEIDLGPIAHWKLDETVGPTSVDSEGGHDGTWTNDPNPAPAVVDGGLDFDGSNDYVDVGSFDVSGSGITLMGWFNAEVLATDDGRIVSKASGPNEADAYWQLSSTDSGSNRYLRMRIKAGGTTTTMAAPSANLSTGQWYFAVGTYDNASGTMKLYLDGVEVASGAHAVGGALDTNPSVPVAIGANGTAERFFNGILDDVRIYDYALPAGEIADLYAANPPPGSASYTEMYQPWSATSVDTWETVDLGTFGVPANAVVEVAVINSDTGKEHLGGVRAVGSSLERRFLLHEAEGNGVDAVTLHVQADASSQIQHYSAKTGNLTFILLGYWTGATYVERFDAFKAGANASWQPHNLGAYGVGPDQVAEIALSQTSTSIEWLVGARSVGSTLQRRIQLHEAESGGIDMVTLMAASDASSMVEVYAEANSVVDFHLLGYWSTPPGTYTENGGVHGQVSTLLTWETSNLTAFGVPANVIAQFLITNEATGAEVEVGVRQTGSAFNRIIDIQEAEGGGSDATSLHVNVDAGANIEWYAQYGSGTRFFYPVGWWVLSP